MKPVKRSVSVAIRSNSDPDHVLIVLRPADDEDLPNAWGLPAISLKEDESWQAAIERLGREKLGVTLRAEEELERGALERTRYVLEMRLYAADVVSGEPRVPQHGAGATQYQQWRWGRSSDLQPAAELGSLCCRLYLASRSKNRTGD